MSIDRIARGLDWLRDLIDPERPEVTAIPVPETEVLGFTFRRTRPDGQIETIDIAAVEVTPKDVAHFDIETEVRTVPRGAMLEVEPTGDQYLRMVMTGRMLPDDKGVVMVRRVEQPEPPSQYVETHYRAIDGADGPCQMCDQRYPAWRAPDDLWNLVMGGPEATDDPGGMLCPTCFLRLADVRAPQRGAWVVGTPARPESAVREERDAQWRAGRDALADRWAALCHGDPPSGAQVRAIEPIEEGPTA